MTVPVSVQQRIRVLDAHGVSWRSIAKEVGVARDTVAKYAGREDCSPKPEHSASRPSKLDPFKATVDGCFASIFLKQFLHYFSAVWAAGFQQELHHMTAQTRTGTGPPCLYIPET